jgi:hypothetical protein
MNDPIEKYLHRHAAREPWRLEWPGDAPVAHAVVIPALAESAGLFDTLDGLRVAAARTPALTLAIVVVNNRPPGHAPAEWILDNQATLARLRPLVEESRGWEGLRLGIADAASPGLELAPRDGVGMARKIGLDLALGVLHRAGRPTGALISLDADTQTDAHYLTALHAFFDTAPRWGAVVPFRHVLSEAPEAQEAMLRYELHLLLHALGLARAGSPYGFPAIGSAMACTASAYAAVSGMRRCQAGEDFYFLQQLAKTGPIALCGGTTVQPAPRVSARVPFGTGRAMATPEEGPCAQTYAPGNYAVIGSWLAQFDAEQSGAELRNAAAPALAEFLGTQDFDTSWQRIQANSRTTAQATAQFHRWFDGFRTLKAIHHLRDRGLPNVPVEAAAQAMLPELPTDAPLSCLRDHAQTSMEDMLREKPMGLYSVFGTTGMRW